LKFGEKKLFQSDGIDLPKNPFEEEEESLNPFLAGPKV